MARNVDAFIIVCRCFSVVTAVAALLCIAVNVLYAVRSFMNLSDVISLTLSLYTFVYLSGIFCLGRIKHARQSRDEAVSDSQEAERRRQELEALLVQERA
ncbi:hypothetical protein C3L33_21111, partial [Rhododendron williamsianum]